jgi:hypothetical protein
MTISNHKLSCSVALVLICWTTLSAESVAQTKVQTNVGPEVFDAKQRQWLACIDPLIDGCEQADKIAQGCHARIVDMARRQLSEEGIDAFLEEALSVRSKATQALNGDWLDLIDELFRKHLFSSLEYKKTLIAELRRFDEELISIEEQIIVRLGADMDYTPKPHLPKTLDLIVIDKSVNEAFDLIARVMENANVKGMNRTLIGVVVGQMSGDKFADSMRNDNGELSVGALLGSVAVGVAAEQISDAAIERLSGTYESARECVRQTMARVVRNCIEETGPAAQQEIGHLAHLAKAHEVDLAFAIIRYIGVNETWAVEAYNARVHARSTTNK